MSPKNVPTIGGQSFEELKRSNDHGVEFWSARDLQPLLGYSQWWRVEDAIKGAITSCEQSGSNPGHPFTVPAKWLLTAKRLRRKWR